MAISNQLLNLSRKLKIKIGPRTIKTAIATPLSLAIAQFFGVSNIATAGILTILCIQPSRRKSIQIAADRFFACILAIFFSIGFFELLGYSAFVLALLLAIFIPTTILLKIEKGIMTSTVITLNIYIFKSIDLDFIYNQFYLIIIGIGTGFIINLYMPSLDKQMSALQKSIEEKFFLIFSKIVQQIKEENTDWDKREIGEIEKLFIQADELVERDMENRILKDSHFYFHYFEIRKNQFEILQQMFTLAKRLKHRNEMSLKVADFIEDLSESIHSGNSANLYLDQLKKLRKEFETQALPTNHQEFELSSILFQMLYEIERFLKLKRRFRKLELQKVQKRKRKQKA